MSQKFIDFRTHFIYDKNSFTVNPISEEDIEILRIWKNNHRHRFFYSKEITADQQRDWFKKYKLDHNQQIFICKKEAKSIVCVGFKKISTNEVDLFNLICGDPSYLGKGFVRSFYHVVEACLIEQGITLISLKVLNDNHHAHQWYQKQGFQNISSDEDSLMMQKKLV